MKEKIVIAVKGEEVLAAGKGTAGEEILRRAEKHKIPVVKEPEKAKKILGLSEQTYLPPEVYGIISEIVSFLSRANVRFKETGDKGGESWREIA